MNITRKNVVSILGMGPLKFEQILFELHMNHDPRHSIRLKVILNNLLKSGVIETVLTPNGETFYKESYSGTR